METNHLRTPPRRSITSSFAVKTERPCSKLRCGRWDLRATKSRQARGRGEGPSQVQGEGGVPNVHGNEDGVPSTQRHNHVNMSHDLASHLNMQGTEGIVNELIMQIMRTA
ncbi:hypothetical protein LOK49_LG06G02810 [Camellia lanceoleosa]|uniref:Uncharacterized protein n=1 Tax=Camellia lanceoleosa TaxID=1840588 RepID=A0ACC0HIV5_9ERIC|nr:hypothetical protein LOK49_LG06G02810 [Camellia lanceoleosa]